jgi:hypothetical protein
MDLRALARRIESVAGKVPRCSAPPTMPMVIVERIEPDAQPIEPFTVSESGQMHWQYRTDAELAELHEQFDRQFGTGSSGVFLHVVCSDESVTS